MTSAKEVSRLGHHDIKLLAPWKHLMAAVHLEKVGTR
jgi:hypothetical protein